MSETLSPPSPPANPNPIPSASHSQEPLELEKLARGWLFSLPHRRRPSVIEMDAWIEADLPESLRSLPRPDLHRRILSVRELIPSSSQVMASNELDKPYRFQRTDQWKPVYSWLESLDANELVKNKEIADWLAANPGVRDELLLRHSRYHLMHYVQRLHLKLLKKKGKMQKDVRLSTARASVKVANGAVTTRALPLQCKLPGRVLNDNQISLFKKNEAFCRYTLLTDLQNQLTNILSKTKKVISLKQPPSLCLSEQRPESENAYQLFDAGKREANIKTLSIDATPSEDAVVDVTKHSTPSSQLDIKGGKKRKRNAVIPTPAWASNEALSGTLQRGQLSGPCGEDARTQTVHNEDMRWSCLPRSFSSKNIAICLQGREKGISWPLACSHGGYAGRNHEKWVPFFEGWRSLDRQFEGPAVLFQRRYYSSWVPTWCAYTSSVAVPQPNARQGVQKVLDVRFHPEGLPQLVCSSSKAPNELLLYNLLSGKAIQLNGHNCQIQAVEFAVRGASVVSCGANLLKVWDCTTGSCLFTLGSIGDEQASVGHSGKINAMEVNTWQSCLVVTSGGNGDGKLLLWNALRGELAADLNLNLRAKDEALPSIDAMEFCSENLLACGSDCSHGGPSVVQLWDMESSLSCLSFPANDSYITSLKLNPSCNTIITGAGDGTIGLFDIRTCRAISHLSVGLGCEVTSVSFSGCGTYFSASSTSNNTLVWDTRLIPMNCGQMPTRRSPHGSDLTLLRPLHCLRHGKQMPTAEHAGQLSGHVDEGDQGVNDARWFHREPVLVTVSGDGSIAMWDVTLGQPCVRYLVSHTGCSNSVAVAPNDDYCCSGGDDQKVVLYRNTRGRTCLNWRLSHPLKGKE